MDTVVVKWSGGKRFVGWDSAGHGVVMDLPESFGGEGTGARPIELVLYALAGCTAVDVVGILRKQRHALRGLEVRITGEQREEQPRIYVRMHIEYVVEGRDIPSNHVERAIALSEEKYCSVRGMLGPDVALTSSYRVVEPEE